jgi:MFS family permease
LRAVAVSSDTPASAPAARSARAPWPERLPPAWTITAALGIVYLILAPSSPDLAAASYRSYLFSHHGLLLWDNSWYGGHHLLAYSVLAPPLGALIGPRLLAAISMTIAAALFAALIDGLFPRRATRLAGSWFALGAAIGLLSSRVPFDLGLALALGALLLARRGRPWMALALTILSSLASPVAGAFLALALLAWWLSRPRRRWPAALACAALAPIALLTLVFPEGGSQPFVASAFYPALAGVVLIALLIGPGQRILRIGTCLYALAMLGAYVLPSAVGGNADRLGALVAGPVAACALAATGVDRAGVRRARALLVLAPFLLYWQANAPVADFAAAASDPAVNASYYAPLVGELRALGVGYGARPARLEVVPTVDHWEARFLAPHVMIARGWERQLDRLRNGLFYSGTPPTAAAYRAWLMRSAVDYVALPDSPLDYSAHAEARLLRSGVLGYLREIWHSRHWRLFAVLGAQPLVQAPASLRSLGEDSLRLYAPRPGAYTVRVRFTPYWALAAGEGCVARAGEDWTSIRALRAGSFHLVIAFSLARIFSRGPRCS